VTDEVHAGVQIFRGVRDIPLARLGVQRRDMKSGKGRRSR